MNKLILDENYTMPNTLNLEDFKRRKELHEAKKLKEEASNSESVMAINSMISNLIQNKWQAIDLLNGTIAGLNEFNRDDISVIISNIISDEYIHIGQLEKALELANTEASAIEAGKDEVDDTVKATDNLPDLEVEESLDEAKGFLKKYKSGSIHDAGDVYVATDKHGTTLGQSKTISGAESFIDELEDKQVEEEPEIEEDFIQPTPEEKYKLPADDIDIKFADKVEFTKKEAAK